MDAIKETILKIRQEESMHRDTPETYVRMQVDELVELANEIERLQDEMKELERGMGNLQHRPHPHGSRWPD